MESIEKALVRRRELRDRIGMAEALHRLGVTYSAPPDRNINTAFWLSI